MVLNSEQLDLEFSTVTIRPLLQRPLGYCSIRPLLLGILHNMCIAIVCFPGCDIIDFETNRIFPIKLFFSWSNSQDKDLTLIWVCFLMVHYCWANNLENWNKKICFPMYLLNNQVKLIKNLYYGIVSLNRYLDRFWRIFAKKATRQRNNLINEDNMPTDCNMNSDTLNEHGLCILRHRRKEESYVKFISVWCELLLSAIMCYSQLYLTNKN